MKKIANFAICVVIGILAIADVWLFSAKWKVYSVTDDYNSTNMLYQMYVRKGFKCKAIVDSDNRGGGALCSSKTEESVQFETWCNRTTNCTSTVEGNK